MIYTLLELVMALGNKNSGFTISDVLGDSTGDVSRRGRCEKP